MWDRERWGGRAPSPEAIASPPAVDLAYDDLELGDQLGETATTEVFEATVRQSAGPDRVAVKRPRLSGTVERSTVERFVDEAEVWERLDDHPHVVGVVGYGSEPVPWIATEFMDGGSLEDRVPSGFEARLFVALGVARAVRHAHRQGVVHHDLKPGNVLFRTSDGWPVPKVADWELAELLLERPSGPDAYTPQYAAPEQLDPDRYGTPDHRTDLFQLGVLCYELLAGEHPFGEAGVADADGPPAPPTAVADVPPALDDLLLTALAPDPDDRQEDVLDLRRGLERIVDETAGTSADSPRSRGPAAGGPRNAATPDGTSGRNDRADSTADPEEGDTEQDAGSVPANTAADEGRQPTVQFATLRGTDDVDTVEQAVRDGDIVLAYLSADWPDANWERLSDQFREVTLEVGGDIVQRGDDELLLTPSGYDIGRTLLTDSGETDGFLQVAEVHDTGDLLDVREAVTAGHAVLAFVPSEDAFSGPAGDELLEDCGDIVQRGESDLVVTPPGMDIAREQLTDGE